MSVQPGPTFKRYVANGLATVYTIPFLLLDAADLQITLNGDPVTTGFTLTGIGNAQSTCTFSAAPIGDLLFLQDVPYQRLADYQNNGDFLAGTVNRDFDRLWLAIKQLDRDSNRALTVSLLEPEGIPPLPVKAMRALKMLAFDASGNPITSNLTLAQLEQQPALALESAAQAALSAQGASLSAGSAAGSASAAAGSATAAAGSATSAAASALSASNSGIQLGMSAWGHRPQPFAGFALDDGQELDRALYPDFAAALDAGLLPTVTQAQWAADPANRACFVAVSSAGKFRMRDRNGVSVGSYGPVFERGGNGSTSLILRDQIQSHGHALYATTQQAQGGSNNSRLLDATSNTVVMPANTVRSPIDDGVGGTTRTGTETYPTHATGAWMTKLFGVITPLGSAEAASLATAYASMASRISALEVSFVSANQTWSNGGTVSSAHGLGSRPLKTSVEAECVTADVGYAVGSVVDMGSSQSIISGANSYGFTTVMNSTFVAIYIAAQGLAVVNQSTRAVVAMTPGSWRLRLKAGKS
ncbi:hypothetical protein [Pseudomonas sp. JAI120]|uniref:hypothetical protein n=1 Tax=Pseudomonas sp. JAI120 TaxID=2723063 RepID=UPI0030DBC4A4